MTAVSTKDPKEKAFAHSYQLALRGYLKQVAGTKPAAAARLGRKAVTLGIEILDLAQVHEEALIAHSTSNETANPQRTILRAGRFFAEAIMPTEATHRTAIKNNARLVQLNHSLDERTKDLSASNRKLKKEVAKRQTVEKKLRTSDRHSRELLDQSQAMQEELRQLSHRILSTQEEERKRISHELHDVVAQTLTGINVHLSNLQMVASQNTKGLTKKISSTQKLVQKSVDIMHRFARELRPAVLDDLGLIPALHSYMKDFMKETGIQMNLTAFAGIEGMSNAKRTVLYRVAQEALTNVARHAQADRVTVEIKQRSSTVFMQIQDNGRSFDVERLLHARKYKRMGLLGMKERVEMVGGTFSIESTPGNGTTVKACIPFRNAGVEKTAP